MRRIHSLLIFTALLIATFAFHAATASATTTVPCGCGDNITITGHKFNDTNGNGKWDTNEPVMSGFTFYVDYNDNGTRDSNEPQATSGSDGVYLITGVKAGTWKVKEVAKAGWDCSYPSAAACYYKATFVSGNGYCYADFGNHETPKTGSVSGMKFNDKNGDGGHGVEDPALSGITIYVDYNDNGTKDSGEPFAVTGADGKYTITGVALGNWKVKEVQQSGWGCTTPYPCYYQLAVTAGAVLTNKDFGNHQEVDLCSNIAGVQLTIPVGKVVINVDQCVIDICANIAGVQVTVPADLILSGTDQCVPPPHDVCANIDGVQTTVPVGTVLTDGNKCVVDICANIDGVQITVPVGYVIINTNQCVQDKCANIDGVQTTVPADLVLVDGNQCVPPPHDICANIDGVQTTVPAGTILVDGNQCVPPPHDICANIDGVQTTVPVGTVLTDGNQCVVDICANIDGVQTTVPAGTILTEGNKCVPPPHDVCANIDGVQTTVPAGTILTDGEQCVPPPHDVCANIDGVQTTVPAGTVLTDGNQCVTPPHDVCVNINGVQLTMPVGLVSDHKGGCVVPPKVTSWIAASGCVSKNFTTYIKGQQIVRVTFYIDNHKVKAVTRADKSGRWLLVVTPARYLKGVHHLKAVVSFSDGTSVAKTKTFYRCTPPRPSYTG